MARWRCLPGKAAAAGQGGITNVSAVMRRRIRQSGSALRKLISSLAAALVLNGKANAMELFLRANPELAMARERSGTDFTWSMSSCPSALSLASECGFAPPIGQVNLVMVSFVL